MKDITLSYKGDTFRIPASQAFALGAAVEEVVTLAEIASWGNNPRYFKIAMAMGAMLRFAGAKVSDGEVKAEMDRSLMAAQGQVDNPEAMAELFYMRAIEGIMAVLFDGAPEAGEGSPPGKTTASSKRRSR
jgi:hypothetical protein